MEHKRTLKTSVSDAHSLPVMAATYDISSSGQPWVARLPATKILQVALPLLVVAFGCFFANKKFSRTRTPSLDFSNIQPHSCNDATATEPHPYRPWKAGKYNMTMGLRKMPEEDWLIIDDKYEEEQELRKFLLQTNREGVMQVLPGAEKACEEALECVVHFLIRRYPSQFHFPKENRNYICNGITNQTFKITKPYKQHPLEIAAQLIMEDINLLIEGKGDDRNYYLKASFSMAPAGWYINERIGWPLWKIHGPVPTWDVKLKKAMENFFVGLKVSNPVQRSNYFIQTDNTLFQQEPFADSLPTPPRIEDIRIRYERQTLRRLPRTNAVMFLVRTYMTPLTDLRDEKDNLYSLRSAIEAWPEPMARYKGRHVWQAPFMAWCEDVLGDYAPKGD